MHTQKGYRSRLHYAGRLQQTNGRKKKSKEGGKKIRNAEIALLVEAALIV